MNSNTKKWNTCKIYYTHMDENKKHVANDVKTHTQKT